MAKICKKVTFETELNADSVEWCPIEGFQNVLVCATYQLCEQTKKRSGILYLFKLRKGEDCLELIEKITTPGVLDCKWSYVLIQGKIFLAVANAVGELRIYQFHENESALKIDCMERLSSDDDTLILSLDWSARVYNIEHNIILSDSKGEIHLVNFDGSNMNKINTWKMHDFEAWIAGFNYWNSNIFFSGGDDCKLKCFDRRMDSTVFVIKHHKAGVTSFQYNFKDEHTFASGSYDESVKFWDMRQWKVPKGSESTGGGIWRIKWEPCKCKIVASSCMYNGCSIVDSQTFKTLATYNFHKNINYGIDWCHLDKDGITNICEEDDSEKENLNLLAVCSFYDNLLSLATFKC